MTTSIGERLQVALGDRYRVVRELSRGGMGTIFEAQDQKHHRAVAIKVLNPELSEVIGARRFQAEIEMAARLMHPHIVPLHDSGSAEGLLYYVMPLVTGESLRQRLAREKQLPLEDAVRIAREVCDALEYAHGQGLVHRDVKPENILLSSGHALVLDFGVAQSSGSGAVAVTRTLAVLGTPLYMSPEQSAGGATDGRSDQYSLACVLYEMLAGQPPFTGGSPDSIALQHRTVEPRPVTALRPSVPPPLAAAIAKGLAKAPADRYPSAAAFGQALAVLPTPALAPTPGSLTPGARGDATTPGRAPGGRVMLAVLPLENMSADPEQEFFTDGMTEELIAHLGRLQPKRLGVIARTSAMRYKKTAKSVDEIGRELGVDHVVEGSVRRSGERLRITVQLIQVADQTHLWAENYDRRMADVFDIQTEVATSVAKALEVQLLPTGRAEGSAGAAANPAAYEAYLRGRFHWNRRTKESLRLAKEAFEEALALDPSYARAYAGLADVYVVLPSWNLMRPGDAGPKAESYARKALELDPGLAEAHASLGGVHTNWHSDFVAAERELRRAIELDPSYVTAYNWCAAALMAQGRLDDAAAMNERAHRLDPQSLVVLYTFSTLYIFKRDFARALAYQRRAREMAPEIPIVAALIGMTLSHQGDPESGIAFLSGLDQEMRRDISVMGALGYLQARVGREEEARAILREVDRLAETTPFHPVSYYALLAGLDERQRLYRMLENDARNREMPTVALRYSPVLDRFRDDPEFQAMLKRVGA
ncbi:MAG: protein kinase domain-containing protein [Bacteroidota bacterium]